MKKLALFTILICGILLIKNAAEFPDWMDPASPASLKLSPNYIKNAYEHAHAPNIVTVVLADYRGFDTMFETTVILSAGLACFFLLRRRKTTIPKSRYYRHLPTGVTLRVDESKKLPEDSKVFKRMDSAWVPYDLILNTTCRIVIPFIQIFALYVVAHGHYSPGGGFQGGVLLGASIILIAVSGDFRAAIKRVKEKAAAILGSIGVFLYAGTGALCLLLGGNFLDYSYLDSILGTSEAMARSHGILIVEIGVAVAVMAVMIWIYLNLSSAGKHDEGL